MYNIYINIHRIVSPGLLHVISKEQHVKSRIAGLSALTALVESAKHYFVAADSRQGEKSVTFILSGVVVCILF